MHYFLSMLFSLLAIIGPVSGQSELKVPNGGGWGSWANSNTMCPSGKYAAGFNMKTELMQFGGDDTALNSIRLYCVDRSKDSSNVREYVSIESKAGGWGNWGPIRWCPAGYLKAFQLKVESYQGRGDDTAANNIKFKCSGGDELVGLFSVWSSVGDWGDWGNWGDWSPTCAGRGICGLKTRVEDPQGTGDDTALNDVIMLCCD